MIIFHRRGRYLLNSLFAALLLSLGATRSAEAFDTPDSAIAAAVENVCKPYMRNASVNRERALDQARRLGFHQASREESLIGISEDMTATFGPAKITITLQGPDGDKSCGVAVQGDPQAFDRYLQHLAADGWISAGELIEGEPRNEWFWESGGRFTIIAGKYGGPLMTAPSTRVLALVVELGKNSIPPVCSPTQGAPCRSAWR